MSGDGQECQIKKKNSELDISGCEICQVSLMIFSLNMVDYPMSMSSLSLLP